MPVSTPVFEAALDLITASYLTLGIYEAGEPIDPADVNDAFLRLNRMLSGWAIQSLTKPTLGREVFPLVAGVGGSVTPYSIGPTGTMQTTLPSELIGAGLLLPTTGPTTGPIEIPRAVLTDDGYNLIRVKDLTNLLFTGVYYQKVDPLTTPNGALRLWPVPSTTLNSLVLYRREPLGQFANLTTQYVLPDGASEAIEYNLCVRLGPKNGINVSQEMPDVKDLAVKSLATFKRSNWTMTDVEVDPAITGNRRTGYNILTGQ